MVVPSPEALLAGDLDAATAAPVARYLDCHTPAERADLAWVLGTRFPDPVPIAARLVLEDRVERVLLAGGVNRVDGTREALVHREALLRLGVPDDRIFVEGESVTTLQNVNFGVRLLRGEDWRVGGPAGHPSAGYPTERSRAHRQPGQSWRPAALPVPGSVVAVARWYHSRRCLMTLRRYLPAGVRLLCETWERPGYSRRDWMGSPDAVRKVAKELRNIRYYLWRGEIAEVRWDGDAWV